MIYPSGRYYEGEFEFGVKNGYGVLRWPNGNVYEGEFVENKREGKGKPIFLNFSEFF